MGVGAHKSPHKYLFLLALAKLYEERPSRQNVFPLDSELENAFHSVCSEFYPDDSGSILIEYPYYHLTNDHIWSLTLRAGKERLFKEYAESNNQRLTRSRLIETTEHGSLANEIDMCFRDTYNRNAVVAEIRLLLNNFGKVGVVRRKLNDAAGSRGKAMIPRLDLSEGQGGPGNPFVAYLNSLQRLDAGNENALAEYQACNESFVHIHVSHPLTQVILTELKNPEGRQVILTGHAGDGKTTIALDVYKRLTGLPIDEPLRRPLNTREDIANSNVTILKDLSERHKDKDDDLVRELIKGQRKFLIVSNTGALLELLREQASLLNTSSVQIESDALNAISSNSGEEELSLGGTRFLVLNLSRIDNLELARQIFTRMLAQDRWSSCNNYSCNSNCPICLNVRLMNSRRKMILDRIFLAYRRMYEYGTRLTLRQLTEHLAYLITSGMEEADLAEMREKRLKPLKAEFMFFNRFFGDNGREDDSAALQMRAVREIRNQSFGERPCPTWERKLWLKLRERHFELGVADCESEFELLRDHGSGPGNDNRPGLTPDQAREQVRRMLFFLYDFSKEQESFIIQFLNSSTILRWQEWQKDSARLEMLEKSRLEQRIFHVLQEHFTGVRLPEGATGHDRRLYITLSRGKKVIRQSAQVVLAQIDWSNEIVLELATRRNVVDRSRTDLEVQGRGRIANAKLILTLPFLDYMTMRHFGEVGEILQPAYVERLEQFKAQIQNLAKEIRNDVVLVRLKTDHTFRRQQYSVRDGKLEANDVL